MWALGAVKLDIGGKATLESRLLGGGYAQLLAESCKYREAGHFHPGLDLPDIGGIQFTGLSELFAGDPQIFPREIQFLSKQLFVHVTSSKCKP